jgi:molybdenum cofactor guanylyltransferase
VSEWPVPADIGGYVLAGGKSSRMGRDKALLELGGRPLAARAVSKLERVCREVHILSSNAELSVYAPLVRDLHEDCGPLGGIEAALENSRHPWNLFLPVDMPFLPASLLHWWSTMVVSREKRDIRLAMFTVYGRRQPAFCLLHKEVTPYVQDAIGRGTYELFAVLEEAAKDLATNRGVSLGRIFSNLPWDDNARFGEESDEDSYARAIPWRKPTRAQLAAKHLWFANLNTPEDLAEAGCYLDALDP